MAVRARIGPALLLLVALALSGGCGRTASGPDADFMARARRQIAEWEYRASATERGLQAPNRVHAIRAWFEPDGLRVDERGSERHLFALRLTRTGRGETLHAVDGGEVSSAGSRVEIHRDGLVEWYENSPKGLEQGFTLSRRPSGEGVLALELRIEGASARMRGDGAELVTAIGRRLTYGGLSAVDARGRRLPCSLTATQGQRLRITVDDAGATYPVVIDPLLASLADGRLRGAQYEAFLGDSVAGAGDVNGDGYADVIVGAPSYDTGESGEGAAFVFHGGPAGIADADASEAATRLEGNQAFAYFGRRVAGAGDVNGDGYDDVIVGAPGYDSGTTEGVAFVFLGGPAGVPDGSPATADGRIDPEPGGYLHGQVAGAGDVNGDGYDDVVVATTYDWSAPYQGPALIFHGGPGGIGNRDPSTADARLDSDQAAGFVAANGAGDVNGDGYDDVIGGIPGYGGARRGAAFVFFGSAAGVGSRDVAAADLRIESEVNGVQLGASVAGAGDVNGDGRDDLIVGAPVDGAGSGGTVLIFHAGGIPPTGGSFANATTVITSSVSDVGLGRSVAGAGDVNGDGYDDVVMGAPRTNLGNGSAFVFLGSPLGIPDRDVQVDAAVRLDGTAAGELGTSVAGAGDVDGDGLADLILGAPYFLEFYKDGAAEVVLGSRVVGAPRFESGQADALLGASVARAGDVNGDGYDDVIVGAPHYDVGTGNAGAAFVFHGGPSGFAGMEPDGADAVLASTAPVGLGWNVAGAGDVNGDGYDDVIVGASAFSNGESQEGAAFIFHGGPSGVGDRSTDAADTRIESNQPGAQLSVVAGAGDVNGDGYDDVVMSASWYDVGGTDDGLTLVFHGGPSGIADGDPSSAATVIQGPGLGFGWPLAGAGDVNGDGYDDVIVGSPPESAVIFHGSASGIASGDVSTASGRIDLESYYGVASVAGAGDVNGDGYDDILVGSPSLFESDPLPGAVFLFHGGPDGIVGATPETADTRLEAAGPGTSFGSPLAGPGDVDGDGYDDIAIGANGEDGLGEHDGAAYLFRGGPGGVADGGPSTAWLALPGQQAEARFGIVAGAGDVNGDGHADVIVGAPYYDVSKHDEGLAVVILPEPGALAGLLAGLLLLTSLGRRRRSPESMRT